MKNNKGFAGVGIIIAIIAALLVGGTAYYVGTKNTSAPQNVAEENSQPVANQNNCKTGDSPWVKVIYPNGGETFTVGQTVVFKWTSCNLNSNVSGELDGISNPNNSEAMFGEGEGGALNSGQQTVTFNSNSKPGTYKFKVHKFNDGYGISDSSDNFFTIQQTTSENSSTEVFNNQPGTIKSIEKDPSINRWTLAIDLLTRNPKWLPGDDSTGPFFLNQNPKIRNLIMTENTKIYNCENKIINPLTDMTKFEKTYKTAYFDINGTNISAIYQQCLP